MDADIYYDEMGKDMRVEPIPEDMMDLAQEYREKLLDAVSMFDDDIMEKYMEGEEIPAEQIRAAIRKATCAVEMIPVVCGTSYKNKGVQKLLDAIVDYMPSPLDIPAIKGVNPDTDEEDERHPDDNAPFSALAFKIATDPYVGQSVLCPRVFRTCKHRIFCSELHQAAERAHWTYCCRCMPTTVRTLRRFMPAISPLWLA